MKLHLLASVLFLALAMAGARADTASLDQALPVPIRQQVDAAIEAVKPALVRIEVVSTQYYEGREWKYQSSGSGVIVTPEGHVVTNHHVAGHATRLKCTLSNKEELEAELIARDPLTDIAIIKLLPPEPRVFPVAEFGDSSAVRVGDSVLAMGSPLSLSQSVTMGIVSNTELVLPEWVSRSGSLREDGEDVGALVRWIGHDAQIFPGNSGGPLVDLQGRIIGINEISLGLGGAIPGDLVKETLPELIADGRVRRAWLGVTVQPRLAVSPLKAGVLVSGAIEDSPGAAAGFKPGDYLMTLHGESVDVTFAEQVPLFNQMVARLPIGEPIEAVVHRDGEEMTLTITPEEREPVAPREQELQQWGISARDISYIMSKEMKRADRDGVLITSVRPGGPAGDARPRLQSRDVITSVGDTPITNLAELRTVTETLTADATEPIPVLVGFDRQDEAFVTVVRVGVRSLEQPGREVTRAWLPAEAQVITRDVAEQLGDRGMTGFRVTKVYARSTAEQAGLAIGDLILAVDGLNLEASAPEDYEELPTLIRQYRIGTEAEFTIKRNGERKNLVVELIESPRQSREMPKYEDKSFEFTARDISFFDKADARWEETVTGVLVEEVKSGSWAALGNLSVRDLILEVNGERTPSVEDLERIMEAVAEEEPDAIVLKVLRGIYTQFVELEPKWETS
jgi:serine protease Do